MIMNQVNISHNSEYGMYDIELDRVKILENYKRHQNIDILSLKLNKRADFIIAMRQEKLKQYHQSKLKEHQSYLEIATPYLMKGSVFSRKRGQNGIKKNGSLLSNYNSSDAESRLNSENSELINLTIEHRNQNRRET